MDGPIHYTIVSDEAERELARVYEGCRKRRGWGPGPPPPTPQYLADQLTLFQPGRADSAHLLLLAWHPQHFSPSGITVYNQKYK